MKKLIFTLLLVPAAFAMANKDANYNPKNCVKTLSISDESGMETYVSSEGCVIQKEQHKNGVVLYISQGREQTVLGFGNDYSFGDFTYCADEYTEINHFEGSQGVGIMIACSEHQNGHAVTRGRAEISIIQGQLNEIKLEGQVKGFLGWKQDLALSCTNLVRQ